MRHVQQAVMWPHHCAVIPFIGNSSARQGFIDTGMDLDHARVYISVAEGAVQIAKALRWSPPEVIKEKDAEIAQLQARLEELEAEVKEADKLTDAARYSLERFGGKLQHKPGRKPNKEKVA